MKLVQAIACTKLTAYNDNKTKNERRIKNIITKKKKKLPYSYSLKYYSYDENNINNENSEDIDKRADKNELDLLVDDKKKNMKEFKFNAKDERFQTKNNIDFAIDPTNKNYKKLKGKKNF